MQRARNLNTFSNVTVHDSSDGFLSQPVKGGTHSVRHGEELLDLYVEDRGAPVTLVMFHSALTNRVRTVPVFQGRRIAEAAGMNLVSLSDPSLERGDIDLAWFLGNRRTGKLRPVLSPLIQHCLESLGSERTVFFGASGGGYAAINFTQDFPDVMVLAVNPRMDMGARPPAQMSTYLHVCHDAVSATPQRRVRAEFVVERLSDEFPDGLPFDLLIFQNSGDHVYFEHQSGPFIAEHVNDPRLFVRLEHTGDGHTPIPGATLDSILECLADEEPKESEAIAGAGFQSASQIASAVVR